MDEEPESLLLRSIGIAEKFLGPDHPQLANSLGGRAVVLQDKVILVSRACLYVHECIYKLVVEQLFASNHRRCGSRVEWWRWVDVGRCLVLGTNAEASMVQCSEVSMLPAYCRSSDFFRAG